MRLTTYADYSLRLLLYLAVNDGSIATIPRVAQSYGISRNHLVKVTHRLGLKGYITTVRGKNGGLRLARSATMINVGDVIRCMEPDLAIVPCMDHADTDCPIVPSCLLRNAMESARAAFLAVLDAYTIADLTTQRDSLQELLHIAPTRTEPEFDRVP